MRMINYRYQPRQYLALASLPVPHDTDDGYADFAMSSSAIHCATPAG